MISTTSIDAPPIPTRSAPDPTELDLLAKEYDQLKADVLQAALALTDATKKAEAKGAVLKEMVTKFGSAHAEKSKILYGLNWEVMCTYGQQTTIDAAAVESFRKALVHADQPHLLKRIFEKTIRWTLSSEASEIIRGQKLSAKLKALFANCQVTKERAPTLVVREKKT